MTHTTIRQIADKSKPYINKALDLLVELTARTLSYTLSHKLGWA